MKKITKYKKLILWACILIVLLKGIQKIGILELEGAIQRQNYAEIVQAMEENKKLLEKGKIDPVRYSWSLNADKGMMRFLLEHGANVNATDKSGNTLLMLATGMGKGKYIVGPDYMELFIEYGADVNQGNWRGLTPVDYAAKNPKENSCHLLISNGAAVTGDTLDYALHSEGSCSYTNYTMIREIVLTLKAQNEEYQLLPILDAAICGDSDEVIQLWQSGVSLDEEQADMLLFNVAAFCSPEALALISEGIDRVKKSDASYQPILSVAALNENIEVVKYLLLNENYAENYLKRLLLDVVITGNLPLIQLLHDYSGGITWGKTQSDFDWRYHDNPMSDAVKSGNLDLIKAFIDWGYPLDEVTAHLAMEKAILVDDLEILKWFLEKGFDVNFDGHDGHGTLLYTACRKGSPAALECILAYGADPNQYIDATAESELALLITAEQNDIEKFKLLMDHGADPNLKNRNGQTAMDIAGKRGAYLILEFLGQG